ncbi:DegT/DnrJ/EryC1/StrS family aminotransferase [Paremcibacter congregatus]|uniref:Aminotransferase DegT n=1 Tax=Paremcibacter congregatus TaxID=2043170 RepID=A0A2G4YRA2_9PROT|nr:DegT/DnrJ/EryC1/StrS aminotransferase family protein [Paremcibacter congregatus]PHZ84852.1 aminotransferase DegT [Paremcibacter congregatus]QDE26175.1 DegT/DnrJ/EryC1/StrS aminotransferase family protein [Paremcibacter congregatus]
MHFIDLLAQRRYLGHRIDTAVMSAINSGKYIMGPEIEELEVQLAEFCGVKHVISCSSGTDALLLPLMAWDIGPGDAVFVPAFTFVATAEVVALSGATPIFCDVNPKTYNIDIASVEKGIGKSIELGLRPKAIIPVDLFGLPSDFDAILALAEEKSLLVLDDACQGFGGVYKGKTIGSIGDAAATSFFPAKPLGCYGDGGATFTNDSELYEKMLSIRVHGQGENRYHNVRLGLNARMDTIQAAILLEKLAIFPEELKSRDRVAQKYNSAFKGLAITPVVPKGYSSAWAQYTLCISSGEREQIIKSLAELNIPTAIYYPIPLHQQPGYVHYPQATETLPVSEDLSERVFSLPMHPYLEDSDQQQIIDAVVSILKG